jgi:hypothetical protein
MSVEPHLQNVKMQPPAEGGGEGFDSTLGAHPREERSQMSLHLALADSEAVSDFMGSLPVRQKLERRSLPRCDLENQDKPQGVTRGLNEAPNLSIPEAVDEVIVHHADRLHVRIHDG